MLRQFAAGRRALELLVASPHRGRSLSGSRGAPGMGTREVRDRIGPRSPSTWRSAGRAAREAGGAAGARASARVGPASPAHGPRSPLAAALRARAPPRGGRFKRLVRGARGRALGRRRGGSRSVQRRSPALNPLCHPVACCLRLPSYSRAFGEQW